MKKSCLEHDLSTNEQTQSLVRGTIENLDMPLMLGTGALRWIDLGSLEEALRART